MRNEHFIPLELQYFLGIATLYENQSEYPNTGERKWVITKGRGWPSNALVNGIYPYAVLPLPMPEVRISEIPRPYSQIHHPELVGGREVIAAGMIRLDSGLVVALNNESGHYMPGEDSVRYALATFLFWGIPVIENVDLDTRWAHFRNG